MAQYEQDPLIIGLSDMDTSPSLSVDSVPTFLPTIVPAIPNLPLQNNIMTDESSLNFLTTSGDSESTLLSTMHMATPDLNALPAFLNTPVPQIDPSTGAQLISPSVPFLPVVDPFAIMAPTDQPDLSPDARTLSVSPPQSQVPSPSAHGTTPASSYPAVSPLDNSINSAVSVVVSRSRANTSLSPPSLPSNFPSPPSTTDYPTPLSPGSNMGDSLPPNHIVIGKMLKDIAKTAIDAGDAIENLQATSKVGELRNQIAQVLDMLVYMSFADKELPSAVPPPHEPPASLAPSIDPQSVSPEPSLLGVAEHPRKRCASELEEHRNAKVLKREPQDEAPLSLNEISVATASYPPPAGPPPQTLSFSMPPPLGMGSQSRPPSRPPTPSSSFSAHGPFAAVKQSTPVTSTFPAFPPIPAVPSGSPMSLSSTSMGSAFTPLPAWPDAVVPTQATSRHHHSLSAGAIPVPHANLTASSSVNLSNTGMSSVIPQGLAQPLSMSSGSATPAMSSPIGRMSRSGSISGTTFKNHYAFSYAEPYADAAISWHHAKANPSNRSGQSNWYIPDKKSAKYDYNQSQNAGHSQSDDEDDEEDSDSDDSTSFKHVKSQSASNEKPSSSSEFPAEYRADVDRIFFEFLNKLCSNLDATDSKGEQIHQTLMAKKMQRLDESPDFRPFKFRIQAFTLSFLDELARQGYPEDKIPMKKVRNYLWRQQYILRFNEDGKKAKSKGNHIWNIEAKKAGDGRWEFRPFHRKLAGTPPGVAYCGLKWSWKPHVWDPQCSFKKVAVTYSSPSLPSWLSWKDGELFGIPPPDAESCTVTAVAKFTFDGQETHLSHTFTIQIAPVSALDSAPYSRSRRSSLVNEQPPKRSTSDSALFQAPQRTNNRLLPPRMDDGRVIRVLQNIAQRVTDEAVSQSVSHSRPQQGEFQDLVKQKHVLEQTVSAYDKALSGHGHIQSRRLAVAAQHVVLQAAQTVIADRTVATGGVPVAQPETSAIESVSVSELTDKTQDAIAMAVKMNGTASNEVDIIVTATSILKSRTPMHDSPAPNSVPPARVVPPTVVPTRLSSTFAPSALSTLAEYA